MQSFHHHEDASLALWALLMKQQDFQILKEMNNMNSVGRQKMKKRKEK